MSRSRPRADTPTMETHTRLEAIRYELQRRVEARFLAPFSADERAEYEALLEQERRLLSNAA